MTPQQTAYEKIAFEFATALTAGDFNAAEQLLSAPAKKQWPAQTLQATYSQMVDYFQTPPTLVEITATLEDWQWPVKQANDIGWAYAAICSDSESEAVTVIVCSENGKLLIRNLEWGRP
jgi:hypothetical protein